MGIGKLADLFLHRFAVHIRAIPFGLMIPKLIRQFFAMFLLFASGCTRTAKTSLVAPLRHTSLMRGQSALILGR